MAYILEDIDKCQSTVLNQPRPKVEGDCIDEVDQCLGEGERETDQVRPLQALSGNIHRYDRIDGKQNNVKSKQKQKSFIYVINKNKYILLFCCKM